MISLGRRIAIPMYYLVYERVNAPWVQEAAGPSEAPAVEDGLRASWRRVLALARDGRE